MSKKLHIKSEINSNGRIYSGDVEVFDIKYDKNGYPKFLVCLGGDWKLISAKHFQPIDCKRPANLENDISGTSNMANSNLAKIYCDLMDDLINNTGGMESDHIVADNYLCSLLNALGYQEVIKKYKAIGKWYS